MPNNWPYTLSIPNAPNDPADDQPNMQQNTNSVQNLLNVDHVAFNADNGGIHKQVRMRNQGAPGLGDGEGCLYAGSVNANSWPIWQNAAGTYEIISFPATLGSVVPLAGKMIMQFGTKTTTTNGAGNPNIITMPLSFPNNNIYCVLSQPQVTSNGFTGNQTWQIVAISANTLHLFVSTSIPTNTIFWWQAIGN